MNRDTRTVGRLIKETRKTKGMTQMELSERVGVSYQQIQKYEKGFDTISVDRLKQIAKALDVPITLFFPSDKDMVAETTAPYGKMTDDEYQLLRLFRSIKNKKVKSSVLELLKTLTSSYDRS